MSFGRWTQFGLALSVSVALAPMARAEGGRPSSDTLSAMGLGGMTVLSDDEGMAIRGHGYMGGTHSIARAFGSSHADVTVDGQHVDGNAHSENGYFAEGKHKAKGSNLSFAGVATISTKGGKGGGGYGDGPPHGMPGGQPGGNYPGGGGGGYPGGGPSHGGGINIKATIIFAGGNSSAWAF